MSDNNDTAEVGMAPVKDRVHGQHSATCTKEPVIAQLLQTVEKYTSATPNSAAFLQRLEEESLQGGLLTSEAEAAKEYLSKLKFNFVEMKTRRYFLEKLCSYQFGETPTCPLSDEEMDVQKQKLQALKAANKDLDEAIKACAAEIAAKQAECDDLKEKALEHTEQFAREKELLDAAQIREGAQTIQLTEDEKAITQEAVDALNDEVETVREKIKLKKQQRQQQKEQRLATREAFMDATNRKNELTEKLETYDVGRMKQQHEKKKALEQHLEGFAASAGVTIKKVAASFVEVEMALFPPQEDEDDSNHTAKAPKLTQPPSRDIHIDFDQETHAITDIVVDGSTAYSKTLLSALSQTGNTSNIRLALAVIRSSLAHV